MKTEKFNVVQFVKVTEGIKKEKTGKIINLENRSVGVVCNFIKDKWGGYKEFIYYDLKSGLRICSSIDEDLGNKVCKIYLEKWSEMMERQIAKKFPKNLVYPIN